ncbi:hypothetical protein [Streptomyces litmocidini]|uniref:hypothetical protein n=1 Tax=Streptomyces litmocidini TaxID=67318 RepID=UPI00167D9689|nr:hypothetical protein [Streptomyces litmocidini]
MTAAVRQQLLDQNEGFKKTIPTRQKNLTMDTTYRIASGQLYISTSGKTSWADSRFSEPEAPATPEQTHRFLYAYQHLLNTDGL